jgi:two-component system phosphate regulon sensor histidine kinase PhoR
MKKKIWITFFILVISTSLATSLIFLSLEKAEYFKKVEEKIDSTGLFLVELLESRNEWTDDELKEIIDIYSELVGGKIDLTLFDGRVITQTEDNLETKDQEKLIFSKKIPFDGEHYVKELTISIFNKDLKGIDKQYRKNISISLAVSLILALIIGIRYMEYAIEPYRELTKATQNIINGVYDEKLIFYDDKDLEYLAQNFNFMSRKLQSTIKELQEANTKLKATLTSIGDGVIAFDNSLNTILINPFAEQILGLKEKEIMGKHLSQVIKDEELRDIFLELIEKGDSNKIEIETQGPIDRVVNIYANPITFHKYTQGRLGTVFIIQDITKIKRLERVREDFVANVSHELKTPMTSLKGFIETLENGAIEDKSLALKFLNIMDIEVNRLNALIDDLLLLSEVENKELGTTSELIYIEEVVDEVFEILDKSAEDKGISLIKEIVEIPPIVQGNYNYFKQMLINLIDNGIKYTPEGGYVKVWAKGEKGNLVIKILDNGVGMAEEEQDRIFERFYRVDKSRSRQIGGTGLGLAIVKHVISIFNGSISIKSKPNLGTTFTIKIPISTI